MKTTIFLLAFLPLSFTLPAQITGKRIADRTKNKVENRTNTRIDRNINKGLDKIEGVFSNKNKGEKNGSANNNSDAETNGSSAGSSTATSRASDFVPGTKTIFQDDFSRDATGDFPAKWLSTGSGSVEKENNRSTFHIPFNTYVMPALKGKLPANFTIEFDLTLLTDGVTPNIIFGLTEVKDPLKEKIEYKDRFYVSIWRYNQSGKEITYGLKLNKLGNKNQFNITPYLNKNMRVNMAVNNKRVRVYFDNEKIIDLPTAITPGLLNGFYFQAARTAPASNVPVVVSNFRIAEAGTDARSLLVSQLLEEGRASTSDILFNTNSDVIQATSHSIIDEIGNAMKAQPSLKIKIVGHTDNVGNAATNLSLSLRRAESVAGYIIDKFNIDENRITTDGKGATQPVADNNSATGKAKNRRVEFIKQ